ncbi:DciA family protein [Ichthyobacterium seriolicida]|uniref:RNA-binding protein n=1 Tax=Ichthyobacterium seriolicida TaxID=242600 RepID=A0A1J1DX31_9FLAO|nr:DciA family protein [Ichthyobacterium seriolicida]BAV94401.1 hypothetical protein JBKA6_0388 [Ichthyobacterium seriolicida]
MHIKSIVNSILEKNNLKFKRDEIHVIDAINSIFPSLKNKSERVYLNKGILYLKINSSVLKQEILYGKNNIVKHINDVLGESVLCDIIIL